MYYGYNVHTEVSTIFTLFQRIGSVREYKFKDIYLVRIHNIPMLFLSYFLTAKLFVRG